MKVASLRRLWHLYIDWAVVALAAAMGVALFLAGVVLAVSGSWITAVGLMGTAASLLTTGIALFFSTANQPRTTLCTSQPQINQFLCGFIANGSRAHIASFYLSWLRADNDAKEFLKSHGKTASVSVFAKADDALAAELRDAGITVYVYPKAVKDPPHFTLINLGIKGSERLAVVRRGLPEHWIDVYTSEKHPQILALAQAYIERVIAKT